MLTDLSDMTLGEFLNLRDLRSSLRSHCAESRLLKILFLSLQVSRAGGKRECKQDEAKRVGELFHVG